MKIKIRQHDASVPQEDGWSQMGNWLAELGGDDHTKPSGDGHAEPDGTDDSRLEALAQADARGQAPGDAAMTAGPETEPDLPAITALASAEPPAATQLSRPRPLEVAQCSLCHITLPLGLLVPDGGQACADIRWYCKDALSCTTRWTTVHATGQARTPAAPGDAFPGTGEAASDEAPAERIGSLPRAAQSAG